MHIVVVSASIPVSESAEKAGGSSKSSIEKSDSLKRLEGDKESPIPISLGGERWKVVGADDPSPS